MPVAGTRTIQLTSSMSIAWEKNLRLPRGVAAVLAALRFSAPAPELLRALSGGEWKNTLEFCDRTSLTLFLGALCRDHLPSWVRERIDRNIAGNTERVGRLRASLVEVATQFDAQNIDYLLLKGFSHEIDYAPDPYLRVGYDIDLFAPAGSLVRAYESLRSIAYVPVDGTSQFPADHYPPLIRKTGWEFRGDFFDPEIPGCIDLHHRFWDPATERFGAPGIEEFWGRRIWQDGLPVLHAADRLGYAALHLLRHLFRASVRPLQVYEIAYFLETKSGDDAFWDSWRELHPPRLRRLQAVAFRLAETWFGCRMASVPAEEVERLDSDILLWFERYAAAPVEAQFHPNKHEIWLHFVLLDSPRERRQIFLRRVFPTSLPGPVEAVFVPDDQVTWGMRVRHGIKYATHVAARFLHHARALPPVIAHGLIWKSRTWRLPAPFWRLLGCSWLFFLGLYQFALLYNLYLLDLGFQENVLGLVASAYTVGSFVGVLPAAAVASRFGLKRTLLAGIACTAAAFALRAAVAGEPALLAAAFAAGASNSLWTVALFPSIAAVTPESARPTAFSFMIGSGIALGMGAVALGGRLPGLFAHAGLGSSAAQSKQLVLLAASACTALALWPLSRVRIASPDGRESRNYPRGPFIRRFLVAIGVWSLATGAFNPLFNAYFARQFSMPVDRIGVIYSFAQAAQVGAILGAPVLLRRLGLARGVAVAQLATALVLALLAPAQFALVAAGLYAAYLSFQYMSEPGIFSSLMNRVLPEQRSGASALNFLVMFACQAIAATAGGAVVARFGYAPMLAGASALAALAAWLFWRLPEESR